MLMWQVMWGGRPRPPTADSSTLPLPDLKLNPSLFSEPALDELREA